MFGKVNNVKDTENIEPAITMLEGVLEFHKGLSQQPKPHSVQQSQASTIHFPPPPPPPLPKANPDGTSTFFTPPITKKINHPLISTDTIDYPLDEKGENISFHQDVSNGRDTFGYVDNRVKELTRVTFEDDTTKNYYVITKMSWNTREKIPRNLYEKIEGPNIVKSVGRYEGKVSGLIFDK